MVPYKETCTVTATKKLLPNKAMKTIRHHLLSFQIWNVGQPKHPYMDKTNNLCFLFVANYY